VYRVCILWVQLSNVTGNITSLIPLGIESCTKTGTKFDNDDASATAILLLTIATGIAASWQLSSLLHLKVAIVFPQMELWVYYLLA
jgi:hypothetical protein